MFTLVLKKDRVVEIRFAELPAEERADIRHNECQRREYDDQGDRGKEDQPHEDRVSEIHHREGKAVKDRADDSI